MKPFKTNDYPGSCYSAAFRTQGRWVTYSHGSHRNGGNPVTNNSLFDLASLTKVVCTLPLCLILIKEKQLNLGKKIKFYVSSAGWFQDPSLGDVTISDLLSHTSGLPAWKPLFSISKDPEVLRANVLQTSLVKNGVRCYSDLGMILLGHLIERISGTTLDVLLDEWVLNPLGMNHTCFNPLNRYKSDDCVATEDCGWRKKIMQGTVHDENAYAMGGISGHAGLFSTVEDLTKYMDAWCDYLGELGLEEEVHRIIEIKGDNQNLPNFTLGWRIAPSLEFSGAGNYKGAFGHTGYTGTSLWFDPKKKTSIIVLNNRVHPTRLETDGFIRNFRENVHNYFLESTE